MLITLVIVALGPVPNSCGVIVSCVYRGDVWVYHNAPWYLATEVMGGVLF